MKVTDKTVQALRILAKYPSGVNATDFAQLMWPDSYMHTKTSNQGNGACQGKAAWLCGGSYLGKLKKAGYAKDVTKFNGAMGVQILTTISPEGNSALEANR